MTIVNEQYTISHLTSDQHKAYYYVPSEQRNQDSMNTTPPAMSVGLEAAPTVHQTAASITPPVMSQNAAVTSPHFTGLNQSQILMLQQFSTQSRLNFEWSK